MGLFGVNKLVIDLDQLQKTIEDYGQTIEDFISTQNMLDKAKTDLESSKWKSGASEAFISKYQDTWKANMEMHVKILTHLQTCLAEAQKEYGAIHDAIPGLGKVL